MMGLKYTWLKSIRADWKGVKAGVSGNRILL
jgi:hypothetical protein